MVEGFLCVKEAAKQPKAAIRDSSAATHTETDRTHTGPLRLTNTLSV